MGAPDYLTRQDLFTYLVARIDDQDIEFVPKDSPINYNLQELEEEKRNLNKGDDEE